MQYRLKNNEKYQKKGMKNPWENDVQIGQFSLLLANRENDVFLIRCDENIGFIVRGERWGIRDKE